MYFKFARIGYIARPNATSFAPPPPALASLGSYTSIEGVFPGGSANGLGGSHVPVAKVREPDGFSLARASRMGKYKLASTIHLLH